MSGRRVAAWAAGRAVGRPGGWRKHALGARWRAWRDRRVQPREIARSLVGEQTSDHAPIESVYGTACRTCATWLADDWETGEFGIAIPVPWPCGVARAFADMRAGQVVRS